MPYALSNYIFFLMKFNNRKSQQELNYNKTPQKKCNFIPQTFAKDCWEFVYLFALAVLSILKITFKLSSKILSHEHKKNSLHSQWYVDFVFFSQHHAFYTIPPHFLIMSVYTQSKMQYCRIL